MKESGSGKGCSGTEGCAALMVAACTDSKKDAGMQFGEQRGGAPLFAQPEQASRGRNRGVSSCGHGCSGYIDGAWVISSPSAKKVR